MYRFDIGYAKKVQLEVLHIKNCSELDQIQGFIHVNLNELRGPYFTEVLRDVQLVEPDVSVLGLPSPLSSCGLGVLRCLDDVPCGVLLVRQLQLLGQALKERARQLGTVLAI